MFSPAEVFNKFFKPDTVVAIGTILTAYLMFINVYLLVYYVLALSIRFQNKS